MDTFNYVKSLCEGAKLASASVASLSGAERNKLLCAIADKISKNSAQIIEANKIDLENARANGIKDAMLDRLMLNEARIQGISSAILKIADLDDPIGAGEIFTRPNGLEIHKMKVPLGLVAMIYEARPNVTPDATSLCLKSGNAVVLRGGKEAICSNKCIVSLIREALSENGIDQNAVSLIEDTSRDSANVTLTDLKISSHMVANVIGMGAKDALYLLESQGLRVVLEGRGVVVRQSLTPGTTIQKGQTIILTLKK
jgi:glutamate-5-semialdehyde dehydrogenase